MTSRNFEQFLITDNPPPTLDLINWLTYFRHKISISLPFRCYDIYGRTLQTFYLLVTGWTFIPTGAIPTPKNNNPDKNTDNNIDCNNPNFNPDSNNPDPNNPDFNPDSNNPDPNNPDFNPDSNNHDKLCKLRLL
jgi:hypothetical protein